jgi:hypothetical protein
MIACTGSTVGLATDSAIPVTPWSVSISIRITGAAQFTPCAQW